MAEAMQRRLLRDTRPVDGFEWAALLTPAGGIGGDFFDFIEPRSWLRVTLIADISGKGISAAMAFALLRFTFPHLARDSTSLPISAPGCRLPCTKNGHGRRT